MEKKVRFGDLVRQSGRPRFVTLWTEPKKDRTVTRAIRDGRVLTILEEPRKRPYGTFGLHPGPHSLFLIFPQPLLMDRAARVIGVNYQLAGESAITDPVETTKTQPKRPAQGETARCRNGSGRAA